eukprot:PhM_4_TR2428/c0_g1_i1/m.22273/K20476/RIC1; RAB6A-GEF complex partner protein 1
MHFCIASPNEYRVSSPPVQAVATSPNGRLLAALTSRTLQVWSISDQRVLLLSVCLIEEHTLQQRDMFCSDVWWSPTGENMAVLMSSSSSPSSSVVLLLQVDVAYLDNVTSAPSLEALQRPVAEGRLVVVGRCPISTPVASIVLTQRHMLCFSTTSHITVAQWSTGSVVQEVCFEFRLPPASPISPSYMANNNNNNSCGTNIKHVSYHSAWGLFAVLTTNGELVLVTGQTPAVAPRAVTTSSVSQFVDFRICGGRKVDDSAERTVLNRRFSTVTVACSGSRLLSYAIHTSGEGATLTHVVSQNPLPGWSGGAMSATPDWCEDLGRLGGVSFVLWGPSEETLVVGFNNDGFALFHRTGVCLSSSFSRYQGHSSSRGVDVLPNGATSAGFDRDGRNLILTCSGTLGFIDFPMARRSHPTTRGPPHYLTRDMLFVLHPQADAWEGVPIPSEYLVANHPLQSCALSDDGSYAVVCGQTGCVIYSFERRRWTMFSAVSQEATFKAVCAAVWLDNSAVLFPNKNTPLKRFEVVIFPRNHLDKASVVYELVVPRRPVALQCIRTSRTGHFHVSILDAQNTVNLYDLRLEGDDVLKVKKLSVHMSLMYSVAFDGIYANPLDLHIVALHCSSCPLLLVHCRDKHLRLLDASCASFEKISVDPVDMVWVDDSWQCASLANPTGHSFFFALTYSAASGVSVTTVLRDVLPTPLRTNRSGDNGSVGTRCACDFGARPTSIATTCPIVEGTDAEFLPIGVLRSEGLIVFGGEGVETNPLPSITFPCYKVRLRPVLYLHAVIYTFFTMPFVHDDNDQALHTFCRDTANKLIGLINGKGCFADSMDWLLHYALTMHSNSEGGGTASKNHQRPRAQNQKKILRALVAALQPYREFFAIVSSCLRKSDCTAAIFDVLGSPVELFNECISRNKIEEAAHLLRIIQNPSDDTLSSLEVACTGARRLFPTVVSRQQFFMAFELLRFIALLQTEIVSEAGAASAVPSSSSSAFAAAAEHPMGALERVVRTMLRAPANINKNINNEKLTKDDGTHLRRDSVLSSTSSLGDKEAVVGGASGLRVPVPKQTIVHQLMAKDKELRQIIEQHAVQLLASGRLAQVCTLFEVFSLDLSYFLSTRWSSVAVSMDLREAFDNIHREFVVPRGSHEVSPPPLTTTSKSSLFFVPEAAFYTPTQERMCIVPPLCATLSSLKKVFSAHGCTEYVLLLSTMLLNTGEIQELLRGSPELVHGYLALLSDPINAGYQRLLHMLGITRTSSPLVGNSEQTSAVVVATFEDGIKPSSPQK